MYKYLILFILLSIQAQNGSIEFVFYNVENLFDTKNDPKTDDDEFTPKGEKAWTKERLETKLKHIDQVLSKNGTAIPQIIALSEIENKYVLTEFIQNSSSFNDYEIAHAEGNDKRGIEVALLYNPAVLRTRSIASIPITLPYPFDKETTRDLLYVNALIQGIPIHIFVTHWSSRYQGKETSEPKRLACANVLRAQIDELFAAHKNPNIIILGDFNDDPLQKSILDVLQAHLKHQDCEEEYLFNPCLQELQNYKGSYRYKQNWNILDQIILSSSFFLFNAPISAAEDCFSIYQEDFMMFKHPKYGTTPNRTYGRNEYYGGYSDHLPVFLKLQLHH